MILILIALIVATFISAYCIHKSIGPDFFNEFICPMLTILGVIGLLFYALVVGSYIGAGYKKDIINREYNTNYTQAEVFYASDVIDIVRELNRNRLEINGDLINNKDSEK